MSDKDEKFKNIEVVEIRMAALPGAEIGFCLRDAMRRAVQEWKNVSLTHNGREYKIEVNAMLASIRETAKP
jgi:hypothetical protein